MAKSAFHAHSRQEGTDGRPPHPTAEPRPGRAPGARRGPLGGGGPRGRALLPGRGARRGGDLRPERPAGAGPRRRLERLGLGRDGAGAASHRARGPAHPAPRQGMRQYLLDTGPLAAYLQGRPGAVRLIAPWIQQRAAATSVLTYAEVHEYLLGHPNYPRRRAQLRELMRAIPPYTLTYAALELYGALRRRLPPPAGPGPIGDVDTLIAATALARQLTVVTLDADYQRVPGLQ